MQIPWKIVVGVIGVIIFLLGAFLFFRSPAQQTTSIPNDSGFGTANSVSTGVPSNSSTNGAQTVVGTQTNGQKIFKIADGPVTGATFIQTTRPTTTIVRYVKADNGHVSDLSIDSPGAVARAVSNTTIPGSVSALWSKNGTAALLQYIDNGTIKTLGLGLPAATTTASSSQAVHIRFFPDNVVSVALSPDGTQAAYLLKNGTGVDGFTSKADGTASKKIFSLALSQVLLSWPAQNTLLLQTKSSSGVPGIAFSANVTTGSIIPLIYAAGLTAIANQSFTHIIYQTVSGAGIPLSISHNTKDNTDKQISFNILPERCVWGVLPNILYCATPIQYPQQTYPDSWYQGGVDVADDIVLVNAATGASSVLVIPGSDDGGVESSIATMTISADGRYLLFVTKDDRSVWGVRLTQ